jgi:hypothetical protein
MPRLAVSTGARLALTGAATDASIAADAAPADLNWPQLTPFSGKKREKPLQKRVQVLLLASSKPEV